MLPGIFVSGLDIAGSGPVAVKPNGFDHRFTLDAGKLHTSAPERESLSAHVERRLGVTETSRHIEFTLRRAGNDLTALCHQRSGNVNNVVYRTVADFYRRPWISGGRQLPAARPIAVKQAIAGDFGPGPVLYH